MLWERAQQGRERIVGQQHARARSKLARKGGRRRTQFCEFSLDALGGDAGLLAGDGFDRYPALMSDPPRGVRPHGAIQPDAAAVAQLGALDWSAGRGIDAADAAPWYLRDRVALDVDEQAALRAVKLAGAPR
jgi:hypothetical protein